MTHRHEKMVLAVFKYEERDIISVQRLLKEYEISYFETTNGVARGRESVRQIELVRKREHERADGSKLGISDTHCALSSELESINYLHSYRHYKAA